MDEEKTVTNEEFCVLLKGSINFLLTGVKEDQLADLEKLAKDLVKFSGGKNPILLAICCGASFLAALKVFEEVVNKDQ